MNIQTPHGAAAALVDDDGREAHTRSWRWACLVLSLGVLGVLALLRETAWSMAAIWWTSSTFNHGFLIVPISGYLIWWRRAGLAALTPKPKVLGLGTLAAASAALVWLLGEIAAVQLVQQMALVTVLQALVVAVIGLRAASVILFPLSYLFFAVPFGTFLIAPLQDVTAAFVVRALQTIGMPVYLDGIFIHIPSGSFEVAEACAGLGFLITSIALGVIFAFTFYRQVWRRILFVALSILLPIVANGFRATGLVLLAHYSNYKLAVGVDHLTYGLFFMALVLTCLLAIGYSFREPWHTFAVDGPAVVQGRVQGPVGGGSPLRLFAAATGVVAFVAASSTYAAHIEGRDAGEQIALSLPAAGSWQTTAPAHADWRPIFPNASQELLRGYTDGTQHVDIYVAYYARQRQGAEVVNWFNSLVGDLPWQRAGSGSTKVALEGKDVSANYLRIVARDRERIVWYWYWVNGRVTDNAYLAKILEVKAKLMGGEQAAAVIALAADSTGDPKAVRGAMTRFLVLTWPFEQIFARQEP